MMKIAISFQNLLFVAASTIRPTARSVLAPYTAVTPKVDLYAKNPEQGPGAEESARIDWEEYDRVPEDALNRILWRMARGDEEPYPTPIHRALITAAPPARESRGR